MQEGHTECAGGDGEVLGCRGDVEVQEGMQVGQGCSRRCGVLGGCRQRCRLAAQFLTRRMGEIWGCRGECSCVAVQGRMGGMEAELGEQGRSEGAEGMQGEQGLHRDIWGSGEDAGWMGCRGMQARGVM